MVLGGGQVLIPERRYLSRFGRVIRSLSLNGSRFFHRHHLADCISEQGAGLVKKLALGKHQPAVLFQHAADSMQGPVDRYWSSESDRKFCGYGREPVLSAGPGHEFVEQCRSNTAMQDSVPALKMFRWREVKLNAFRRLPNLEPKAVRIVLTARKTVAAVFDQGPIVSTAVPLGGVNWNSLAVSLGFQRWSDSLKR